VTKQRILLTYLLLVLLTISTIVFILPPLKAEPTTWTANKDNPVVFSTIQDALAAANNGDSAPIEYKLNIAVSGYGSTSPAVGSHFYEEGSEIAVYATDSYSAYGWLLENWILDGSTIDKHNNPLYLTMDENHELTAVFVQAPIAHAAPETTSSPIASPEPTPEIPELTFWVILLLFMTATLLTAIFYFKKFKC
jgi:hypothetical protein